MILIRETFWLPAVTEFDDNIGEVPDGGLEKLPKASHPVRDETQVTIRRRSAALALFEDALAPSTFKVRLEDRWSLKSIPGGVWSTCASYAASATQTSIRLSAVNSTVTPVGSPRLG
jgi:hypothetical protein